MTDLRRAQNNTQVMNRDMDQKVERQEETKTTRSVERLVLVAICLGYFLIILDSTVVNVALPNIQQQLGGSVNELQWIVDGYLLVFASVLLTGGALGDRLGNKRIFLIGLALFTVASALCGVAPNMWVLQVARLLQGLGAAFQVPTSLALLNHSFHDPRERARAIGVWGGIAGIAACAGPVVGGLLVNTLTWRSAFILNVPVGILAVLLTVRYVAAVPGLPQRGLDFGAQVTGFVALALLTLAFIQGKAWGWSSLPILGALAVFVLSTVIFVLIERRSKSPMLPLELFGSRTFSAANAVGLLLNFGFYGQLFFMNLFFQNIWGYSALLTGLALLPQTGSVMVSATLSGRVTARTGPRVPMVIGLLAGGCAFLAMMLVNEGTGYLVLCPMLLVSGFGIAFTMPAMTTAVVAAAPRERSGIASGVLNASRQVGSALGVALLGSLVSQRSTFIPGMHVALAIAGAAYLVGCMITLLFVRREATANL
ncbi:MAG TPA: MFS transporter [Ktedonobacteraceae bacterium]|nr:MFS transporter [Ktedonobacteraceae bacterium]